MFQAASVFCKLTTLPDCPQCPAGGPRQAIPACVLVLNRDGASGRKSALFINADREYRVGKNQNSLRAEDIEKITHVYRKRLTVDKYAREVPYAELEWEDFNLNIRRYVDNSPPPEPHDVRAHLHGGIPVSEIDQLAGYFDNYGAVRELLFQCSHHAPRDDIQDARRGKAKREHRVPRNACHHAERDDYNRYGDFVAAVKIKDNIKGLIESAPGVQAKHTDFHKTLEKWWRKNVAEIERLPDTQNVFDLRRHCIDGLPKALVPLGVLDLHQVRGAVAQYMKTLEADLKSVAASGWGAELIPEDEILQSQFPEVLEQIEKDQARIAELEGLFAAANASEDEDAEEADTESGVLPKSLVKALKDERKTLSGEIKEAKKRVKDMRQDADRMAGINGPQKEINELRTDARDIEGEALAKYKRIEAIDAQLARHTALEDEYKKLRANIRASEKKKEDLIAAARAKIREDEARQLILARFQRLLTEQFDGYLRQYQRAFIAAVENLWDKYAVTTKQILAERDQEAAQLDAFLKELGYE